MSERIGVYICHCGTNIANTVDVRDVAEYARTLPDVVVVREYKYMCSDPGQEMIKKDIEENQLTRVVVSSCSPLMHENTFRGTVEDAGMNRFLFQMSNIREQCSWVHTDRKKATEKAKKMVAGAVSRVRWHRELTGREVKLDQS
ncbi:MAG: CoB--CoM heterodisulfide reductase iron-sulfur subunit A family protein, partial [Candidatus Glassbacteria bacterium]|nr:CoB--CoM heterodisulfide reductase iron-sulfur subunit A family protein [Candidatus Glassbacteria bacterium]